MARSSLGPGLDGILVVDKPVGPTSHDIVGLVRRLAATKRVGHGGTLDPFASGVLPVFLGRGTRVVEFHLADRKAYRATVCFGASSTTDDLEGEMTPADGPAPSREAVEAALPAFMGAILQRPPAYSAIKVAGRRAYAMARAGETVELTPREVTIETLTLVDWDGSDAARPIAIIDVRCSAGTYVRSLARDLGPDNIRVNTILPGWIMTERQLKLWVTPEGEMEIMKNQCLKRKLYPIDIARMALFLASDEASACTNQDFIVDGGWV